MILSGASRKTGNVPAFSPPFISQKMPRFDRLPLLLALLGPTLHAAEDRAALDRTFALEGRPLLKQYCLDCHNPDKRKGDLDLTPFTSTAAVQGDFKLWQKVLRQVEDEEMPPKDPQPAPAERGRFVEWIFKAMEGVDWSEHRRPGRVTIPRLTKDEYSHTLRDLLGVDLRAGDSLLDDGQGQSGFNNDRDSLFVSPALAGQYFDAADRALDGLLGLHRGGVKKRFESETMFMTERGSKPEPLPGGGTGYALNRGQMTLYDSVTVPCDGWYRFTVRAVGVGGDSGARLRIDDEPGGDIALPWNKPQDYVLTVLLRKGTHQMAWNIETPRELLELRKQQQANPNALPRSSLRSSPEAQATVKRLAPANAPAFPASPEEAASAAKKIRSLDGALVALQRPIEWLRLTTSAGDRDEISSILNLLPERLAGLEKSRRALASELKVQPAEIERRLREANAARLADNQKILADARAAAGSATPRGKTAKVGNAGIDWIEIEGPVVPEGQPGDLVFTTAGGDAAVALASFLPHAFRRPVKADETRRYLELYRQALQRGEPHEEALKLALLAALVSPDFLFREEFGGAETGTYDLSDYQLASRLSYFLWMSMPDGALTDLAATGKLHEPAILRAQVKRLVADGRSRDFIQAFLGQWLGFASLGTGHVPDAKKFREFTPELSGAMKLEPVLVFEKLVRQGGSLLDLLDGRETFVNAELARHYRIRGVQGDTMQPVKLEGENRGGLLGMGAILTTTSSPNRTSPVLRGKWILETLLGRHLAEPPADAGQLDANAGESRGKTLREELAAHRRNESCAACHAKIDPLGFGLENFDAIGRYRENEAGKPVDARGELPGGVHFTGAAELRGYLLDHSKDEFMRHITRRLLAFALGRDLTFQDEGTVREIFNTVKDGGWRADLLLEEIVLSRPFRQQEAVRPAAR
jgi:hypothetical protein